MEFGRYVGYGICACDYDECNHPGNLENADYYQLSCKEGTFCHGLATPPPRTSSEAASTSTTGGEGGRSVCRVCQMALRKGGGPNSRVLATEGREGGVSAGFARWRFIKKGGGRDGPVQECCRQTVGTSVCRVARWVFKKSKIII